MKNKLLRLILMVSKYTFIGIFLQCVFIQLIIASDINAQRNISVKDVEVEFNVDQARIVEIFSLIEERTDFKFSYDKKDFNKRMLITFSEDYHSVEDILLEISRQAKLRFKQVNAVINVMKMRAGDMSDDGNALIIDLQARQITGKVTSEETPEGLPGVSVIIKGSSTGTVTDINGNYSIDVSSDDAVLVFSSVGYVSEEIAVSNQSVINVDLVEDIQHLQEIVVVGYGTQKKSDVTGSLVSLPRSEFDKQPITRIDQALQGRTAGVQITQVSGAPGDGYKIRIRGVNSISGQNSPLFVIDGMVVGSINSININDIESMEVLKDASATAIYGSRGANGVVLITTKRGKEGPAKVEFDAFYGVSSIHKRLDIMSGADFAEGVNASEGFEVYSDEEIAELRANGGEDWQDRIFKDAAFSNYQLSVSGGNENLNYYVSGNFNDQDGPVVAKDYKRYSFRANLNARVSERLDFGLNIYGSREERDGRVAAIPNAVTFDPTTPAYDENGEYNFVSLKNVATAKINPLIEANSIIDEDFRDQIISNGFINYQIAKGLVLNISGGLEKLDITNNEYEPLILGVGEAEVLNRDVSRYQNTNRLTYTKETDNHRIQVDAIHEQQYIKNVETRASSEQFFSDLTTFKNLALGGIQNNDNSVKDESLQSFVGRANYSFMNRYMLTATVRADGSSKFRKDNRWGVFPSGSVAWRLSEEGFLQSVDLIDNLKLRASYGITGSQAISALATRSRGVVSKQYNYPFDGGTATVGVAPSNRIANPDLTWEETAQTNFGLDLGLWTSKITLSLDYYKKNTTDLLLDVVLPQFVGANTITQNVGEVENKGFDIALGFLPIDKKDFSINTTFNLSKNDNKVISLLEDDEPIEKGQAYVNLLATQVQVGKPISSFRGYVFEGVYQLGEEDLAAEYNRMVGDAKYADINDDGIISSDDITTIGDGNADFTWGWNTTISYKAFDLNILFVGSQGNDVYNFTKGMQMGLGSGVFHAVHEDYKNRWTPENPSNIPSGRDGTQLLSSQFLEDGSFTRLKNLSLSYSFINNELLGKIGMSSLRIYASAENLFTLTDYSGYDPEPSSSRDSDVDLGIDWYAYPIPRSFTIGIGAKF